MTGQNNLEFKYTNQTITLLNSKKIISALNGNFLTNIKKWPQNFSNISILWVDGLLGQIILFLKFNFTNRVPGFYLLLDLLSLNKSFTLIGTKAQLKYFTKHYPSSVLVEAPFFTNNLEIINFAKGVIVNTQFVIIGISTPKQELLAIELYKKNKYSIFCLGGALNMLIGSESRVPLFISKIGLEWLWRIHSEPLRRIIRLFNYLLLFKNIILIVKTRFSKI